jgi:hypothetical protein
MGTFFGGRMRSASRFRQGDVTLIGGDYWGSGQPDCDRPGLDHRHVQIDHPGHPAETDRCRYEQRADQAFAYAGDHRSSIHLNTADHVANRKGRVVLASHDQHPLTLRRKGLRHDPGGLGETTDIRCVVVQHHDQIVFLVHSARSYPCEDW